MIEVVGICFKQKNNILIAMPRSSKKTKLYTLIGGKVSKNEEFEDAVIRETKEELNVDIKKEEFKLILEFKEKAGSDPNLMINMHMYLSEKEIETLPTPNDEILEYKWFNLNENPQYLCDSIKCHLLPYLKK